MDYCVHQVNVVLVRDVVPLDTVRYGVEAIVVPLLENVSPFIGVPRRESDACTLSRPFGFRIFHVLAF